jgi:hypothetical protein
MKVTGLLVILLLYSVSTIGQSEEISSGQEKAPLQLTISLNSKKYCTGDAGLDALRMNLKLRYTNFGEQPLILYKGSNLISRLMISRSFEDATAGRFEVNASLTHVTDEGGAKLEMPTPGSLFVILPAGASYETQASISVFAVRDEARRIEGAIDSGEHVLQVEVPTWPASNGLAKKLHDLWRQSGCLWYEPVISAPMRFKVEKERKIVDCP